MFHVGLGIHQNSGSEPSETSRKELKRWESKFSSDPLVCSSSSSDSRGSAIITLPAPHCELKLFRDFGGLLEGVPFDILPAQRGRRILMLGVPCGVDLNAFIDRELEGVMYFSELRRTRRSSAPAACDFDRSALLVFRSQEFADRFFRDWHIQFFDSEATSGPVCYLVYVDKLFVLPRESPEFQSLHPVGSQQIPSCAFCIERIDVNVSGIITSRRGWLSSGAISSASCVCCSQLSASDISCTACASQSVGLWLCLLCGNVGCGRYAQGHAEAHSKNFAGHRLSLEIATGRIWDYKSDQFVHRRIVKELSAPILDLPERIDPNSLPVHPQVSFEEDIRELNKTMTEQLSYERSKYEEACTQLRMLGASRAHAEEELLAREQQQEAEMRAQLARNLKEKNALHETLQMRQRAITKQESNLASLKRRCKELTDQLKQKSLRPRPEIAQSKLDELLRLEAEAERLRLLLS